MRRDAPGETTIIHYALPDRTEGPVRARKQVHDVLSFSRKILLEKVIAAVCNFKDIKLQDIRRNFCQTGFAAQSPSYPLSVAHAFLE